MSTYNNNSLDCLVNQKVVIYSGRYRYCVIICEVCSSYIRAVELGSGNIRIFNLERVDYIEDILP